LEEKIEVLPVSLLEEEAARVAELKSLARRLNLEFGWHYLLDLTWILSQLETIANRQIMDAGAGWCDAVVSGPTRRASDQR
jgi:hypothetical protein